MMDENIVRAYIWQDIIRLGFSPSGTRDQKSWLHQYGQSLRLFWQIGHSIDPPKDDGRCFSSTIDSNPSVNFLYQYAIENINKFSVEHIYSTAKSKTDLMWIHDIDGKYFKFPNQLLLAPHNDRNQIVQNMDNDDLEAVINSLIVHPIPHQHMESPIDNHEIRIGGGLINPFLYLFNLRYQLCPDSNMRNSESDRLFTLFYNAIKENKFITPNSLMMVPDG